MKPLAKKMPQFNVRIRQTDGLSVSEWADRIRFSMRASIDAVLYLAWKLRCARADFQDQQEQGQIKSWRRAYSDMLAEAGLSKDKAKKLIAISNADNLRGVDKSILPEGWSLLSHLAELPKPVFRSAVEAGKITPQITRQEIRQLNPIARKSGGRPPFLSEQKGLME